MKHTRLDCGSTGRQWREAGDSLVSTGDLLDALTELYRLDLEIWGDSRTAHVFRCVAAANYKDGRAAKLSGIADCLDLGVATVHARLKLLGMWCDAPDGQSHVLVERVPDGYYLTAQGERLLRRWLDIASARPISKLSHSVNATGSSDEC